MKKCCFILSLMLALSMAQGGASPFQVYDPIKTSGDYKYKKLYGGGVEIVDYLGSEEVVTVPDTLGGEPVVEISKTAFVDCETIRKLVLPQMVHSFSPLALEGCTSLEMLVFTGSLSWANHVADFSDVPLQVIAFLGEENSAAGLFASARSIPSLVLIAKKTEEFLYRVNMEGLNVCFIDPDHMDAGTIAGGAMAADFIEGNYVYVPCQGGVEIIGYARKEARNSSVWLGINEPLQTLELPQTLGGQPVVSIGAEAFIDCKFFEQVILPQGLRSIGLRAFMRCSELSDIILPEGLESIGDQAFWHCYELASVQLPASLKEIHANPFTGCDELEEIAFTAPNERYAIVDGALMDGQEKRLICYPPHGPLERFLVPEGTEIIGEYAFDCCEGLTEIVLPEGLRVIEEYGFAYSGIRRISLPSSVEQLGDCAFYWCADLEEIVIPDQVKRLGDYTFFYCSSLRQITLPEGLEQLGKGVFNDCYTLESIHLPDSLETVASNPFADCRALKDLSLSPDHPHFFMQDGVLFSREPQVLISYPIYSPRTHYRVPEGTVGISADAFEWCEGLQEVLLPEGLAWIGEDAFFAAEDLEYVYYPDSLTRVSESAFSGIWPNCWLLPLEEADPSLFE